MTTGKLIIIYICSGLAFSILTAYIFSIFLGVRKQLWYQDKQLDFLIQLAHKAGLKDEEIKSITDSSTRDNGLPLGAVVFFILFFIGVVLMFVILSGNQPY